MIKTNSSAKATAWVMLLFHVLLHAVIVVSISTLEIGRFKKATTISNVKMPKIIFLLKDPVSQYKRSYLELDICYCNTQSIIHFT